MSGMNPAQVDASLGLLRNFDELQDVGELMDILARPRGQTPYGV